jgi:hypothetical protein
MLTAPHAIQTVGHTHTRLYLECKCGGSLHKFDILVVVLTLLSREVCPSILSRVSHGGKHKLRVGHAHRHGDIINLLGPFGRPNVQNTRINYRHVSEAIKLLFQQFLIYLEIVINDT